tara:strand:+ start:4760 stop:5152 length:393 start_codon:yes stop_codon:yes gene_type:complete
MIFSKGNKLNSIIPIRCPQCHKGKFLKTFVYDLSRFTAVRNQCDCCGLKYRLEPSFYFGSMYVAYAIGVALMVIITLISYVISSTFSFLTTFVSICIVMVLLGPYINALSKIIWANMFFSYQEIHSTDKE